MKTSTKTKPIDRTPERLVALKQFKEGDRVFNKLTKQHGVFVGVKHPSNCWVRFDVLLDDEWFIPSPADCIDDNPLNLELCQCNKPIPPIYNPVPSNISTSSPELDKPKAGTIDNIDTSKLSEQSNEVRCKESDRVVRNGNESEVGGSRARRKSDIDLRCFQEDGIQQPDTLPEKQRDMPAVQQGVQVAQLQPEILQQQLQESESAVGRRYRKGKDSLPIGDDSKRSGDLYGNNSESGSQHAAKVGGQVPQSSEKESGIGDEQQLERREVLSREQGARIHSSSMPEPPQGKEARGLCASTHSSNGEVLGEIPELLARQLQRERGSTPHQPQQARQPNREPSIDERSRTHQASQQPKQTSVVEASDEYGHQRNLPVSKGGGYCNGGMLQRHTKSGEEWTQIIWSLLGVCQNLDTWIFFLGWVAFLMPVNLSEELLQLNSSRGMSMLSPSLEVTGEISPSIPISETIIQESENLICLQGDFPVQAQALPDCEQDSIIQKQPSGGKCSESLLNADPNSLLLRIQKVCLSEELESVLPLSEWQDIVSTTRNSYQQRNSEQRTIEQESLSCPTLTSGSKTPNSRAAGTTKCERWFKEQGLIPDGYQLSAPAMAKLMGYPEDWFKAICPYPQELPAELEPDILPEEPSHQIKQESPCNELSTSTVLAEVAMATPSISIANLALSPMTVDEAKAVVEKINSACNQIRISLVDLEKRKGYLALGFTSMNQLLKSNLFAKAKSTLRLELVAGKIEDDYLLVPVGTLPERHLRPLSKLKSDYYGEAMKQAKEIAGDRPLMAKDVSLAVAQLATERPETRKKSIVDTIKEKTFVPYTDRVEYAVGDVVIVNALGDSTLRPIDGYWGIIDRVSSFAYHVLVAVEKEIVLCKVDEMKRVELGAMDKAEFKAVSDRIASLQQFDLDDADDQFLDLLQRRTVWTPRQLLLLQRIEEDYASAKIETLH